MKSSSSCLVNIGGAPFAGDQLITEVVADGHVRPVIAGTFPLEEAERLQQRVTDGVVIGRDVLEP